MMDHINTEGVARVGELDTRAMKEARVAEDYRNSLVSGQVRAFQEMDRFVESLLQKAGPYDDTRNLLTIRIWLGDKIREVQPPATMEDRNA